VTDAISPTEQSSDPCELCGKPVYGYVESKAYASTFRAGDPLEYSDD